MEWIRGEDFPEWAEEGYLKTITNGYLNENETPKQAYQRIAKAAAKRLTALDRPSLEQEFFDIMWKGWLIPSTPVMANLGTDKGLPCSCFGSSIGDSISDIWRKVSEVAMMSKVGGGTAGDFSNIRPVGSLINGGKNGKTSGIIPFIKVFDATIAAAKQGETRRGAFAAYLNANHVERDAFLQIVNPSSGENYCKNVQTGLIFDDEFMKSLEKGPNQNRENQKFFLNSVKMSQEKAGVPYKIFIDNANKSLPQWQKDKGLWVKHSNLCTEIFEYTDNSHSFTCFLSSLNLFKYREWKDTETVFLGILFLDACVSEFIEKASGILELADAVRFAIKARALGLGVQGFHSYLQDLMIPYDSLMARHTARIIFGNIKAKTEIATLYLGQIYGEPEWCKGSGRRNMTLTAIAPTRSSSQLSGGMSEGMQPYVAAVYTNESAKAVLFHTNPIFIKKLQERGLDVDTIVRQVSDNKGQLMNLDLPEDIKDVFKSRFEINQKELVSLTAVVQEYIEQGISCNLSFPIETPMKFIVDTHILAWKLGLKSLYYFKSESLSDIDKISVFADCKSCEG